MSSLRRITYTGVGLLGTVATLTACAGDGQQGIPTETQAPPTTTTTTQAPTTTTTTTTAPPAGPAVGDAPGEPQAAAALRAFLTDLDAGGVPDVDCFTVPPTQVPVEYADIQAILDAAAAPGRVEGGVVTWTGPVSTLSIARDEIASGYACPRVRPTGTLPQYTDLDAEYTVERYIGRFTGTPFSPDDLEGDYPVVCDATLPWDPEGTGVPTIPTLPNNPGRLTGSASYNPDSVYVAYSNGEYKTVYADITNVSGFEQNQVFTLLTDGTGYCIGDVA